MSGRSTPQAGHRRLRASTAMALVAAVVGIALPAGDSLANEPPSPTTFVDVGPDDVHGPAIARLVDLGVVKGVSSDRFDPTGTLTRGQLASMLAAALDSPEPTGQSPFTDTVGSVHAEAIDALAEAGIVTGTTAVTYSPGQAVTRGQLAAMLVRVDGYESRDPLDATVTLSGMDESVRGADIANRFPLTRGHMFERELIWASLLDYLHGAKDGTLRPDDAVTRAQAASLMSRFLHGRDHPPTVETAPRRETIQHGAQLTHADVGPIDSTWELVPSGPVTTERNGQVIENLDILVSERGHAGVLIRHDDVIVRNNRIRHEAGADGVRVEADTSGALVEHNLLDAVRMAPTVLGHLSDGDGGYLNNNVGSRSVTAYGQVIIRRNHVLVARSGFRLFGSGSQVAENYVDRLFTAADSPEGKSTHGTSISLPGGPSDILVERNRVVAGASGGIVLYAEQGVQRRIDVVDNLVVGFGQGMGIYGGRSHLHTGHYEGNRDVRIEGNRFSGEFGFPGASGRGTNTAVDLGRPGNTFAGNRWVGADTDLPARCGIKQDTCEYP